MNRTEAVSRMNLAELQTRALRASGLLKAMSNPVRLLVLCQLAEGEKSVGELEEVFGWSIDGSEYESLLPKTEALGLVPKRSPLDRSWTLKYELDAGDVVYLDGGRASGLSPGMVLEAVQPEREVYHPVTGKRFGRYYATQGRVRVLSVQDDGAIAEEGTHAELLAMGGLYARFWNRQSGGFIDTGHLADAAE